MNRADRKRHQRMRVIGGRRYTRIVTPTSDVSDAEAAAQQEANLIAWEEEKARGPV